MRLEGFRWGIEKHLGFDHLGGHAPCPPKLTMSSWGIGKTQRLRRSPGKGLRLQYESRNWILRTQNGRQMERFGFNMLYVLPFSGDPNVGICTDLLQRLVPTINHAIFFKNIFWQLSSRWREESSSTWECLTIPDGLRTEEELCLGRKRRGGVV